MSQLRFDPPQHQRLFDISWEADRRFRMNPGSVTSLLREQVPVLNYVKWSLKSIEPGVTQSVLPLNTESTNQHFTHQGALFLLAAEYTAGTALASLLTGWPVIGVHPVETPDSVSLWLIKADMRYIRPSVEDLIVTAHIDPLRHTRVRERFAAGKPVIETIDIEFRNGQNVVAKAKTTCFARQTRELRSLGPDGDRVHALYELKLTSSAEMIAGVRARENGELFDDPYADAMAGQHGRALAERFCERSPQLGGMVAARTWHLDSHMSHYLAGGGRNVVIVGVGWDMRTFRLDLLEGTRVFELDLPPVLAERRRRLAELGIDDPPGVERTMVPIDLSTTSLASAMREHVAPDESVFVAWEGMSMYFEEDEAQRVLRGMAPMFGNPQSRLWCDVIRRDAIERPESYGASVANFMRGMQILGEPFRFGVDRVEDYVRANGFRCLKSVTSDVCLPNKSDPVYSIYEFCVAAGEPARVGTPHALRPHIDAKSQMTQGPMLPTTDDYTRVDPLSEDPSARL
ncbi:MAG: SAM-dependent methyltransferase [Planctomycetales bacterium]|nr:SAM-dependent methyltransferase [Planctomycetales bacterium]